MSNDLVARLRWYVTNVSSINNPLVPALQKIIAEAADALSQTIPRTTDEGMREIVKATIRASLVDEVTIYELGVTQNPDILVAGCKAVGYCDPIDAAEKTAYIVADAILAAMCRVSKTDEGRNAVTDEMVEAAVKGMCAAKLKDDEGPIAPFRDLIDCSGENLFWNIARGLARAALEAALTTHNR